MSRKGYTLVEALTAIFVLAIGLLALTAVIVGGVLETNRTIRTQASQQCFDNALALARIAAPNLPVPVANKFVWVYQDTKSPGPLGPAGPLGLGNVQDVAYTPANSSLGLVLDVTGPYEQMGPYTNPTTGQSDRRPFFTGKRAVPVDPARYSWAYAIRPVPGNNPDQTLVDVSVVVFEDYDPNDPQGNPYRLTGASLQQGQPLLQTAAGPVPTRAIILDGQNGYVYRLASGEVIPPPRANSSVVIVLPRAVETLELGILSRR